MKQLYVTNKNRTQYQINKIKRYLSRYTIVEISLTIISMIFISWFTLSFIDIIHNNMDTYNYAKWNIIILLADKF